MVLLKGTIFLLKHWEILEECFNKKKKKTHPHREIRWKAALDHYKPSPAGKHLIPNYLSITDMTFICRDIIQCYLPSRVPDSLSARSCEGLQL